MGEAIDFRASEVISAFRKPELGSSEAVMSNERLSALISSQASSSLGFLEAIGPSTFSPAVADGSALLEVEGVTPPQSL